MGDKAQSFQLPYDAFTDTCTRSDNYELIEYKYQPIESENCIRILVLAPGEGDDPLRGKLEVASIDSAGNYESISYGFFLRFAGLRLKTQERRVWADQICINQDNDFEKGQQVQLMNQIYKRAKHVLVWLGPDEKNIARAAFDLINNLHQKFQDKNEREILNIQFDDELEKQEEGEWLALHSLTARPWFKRGWIVQEIGTQVPATMFWGDEDIDWAVLYKVCEELTQFHRLRTKFDIKTSDVKFLFQRFIEPNGRSYHANRFSFIYELHRARGLKFSEAQDRVFAFLGHYALHSTRYNGATLAPIKADYKKTVEQVFVDTAKWALKYGEGGSALIVLAAVQHKSLPSRQARNHQSNSRPSACGKAELPSWVPDWRTDQAFILSEPINPHHAHGISSPKLQISEDDSLLQIHGLEVDAIAACSRLLVKGAFHEKKRGGDTKPPIEYLWHEICQKHDFNLHDRYLDGKATSFFAFMQTLSNGCVQIAGRGQTPYHEIPEVKWLKQAALYLTGALGESNMISPTLRDLGEEERKAKVKEEWSRSANGASKNRKFARTEKGYYVLGPAIMEPGDVLCVLFGGKMPFCLRPMGGGQYLLVGECYAHGLMNGEAMDTMDRKELTEQVFEII